MTDIDVVNKMKAEAVALLLEETFTHVRQSLIERYTALGKENAKLLNVQEVRFMYAGEVYPNRDVPTIPYGSRIPALHYSLLGDLETINKAMSQENYHYVKNFFVAVIGQSQNGIVLNKLLPAILIDSLKSKFTATGFKVVDTGVYGELKQEPIFITEQNIQELKNHYQATIVVIRNLLMDKLLSQA